MRRPSPVTMIAAGLVSLSCAMVLLGDFFFGYLPDRPAEAAATRKRVVDNIALPATTLLSNGELARLQGILDQYVEVNRDLRSIGVRRSDGQLLMSTRQHAALWTDATDRRDDDPGRVRLPLLTPKGTWGNLELRFADPPTGIAQALRDNPGLLLLAVIVVLGSLTYWLYMRRVLQQFDPSAVIPERVRVAFDAMTEGVVVLDRKGRIALANTRFREFCGADARADFTARELSSLDWIARAMSSDTTQHPWSASMREQRASTGTMIETKGEGGRPDRMVVNCAPIVDGRQQARGCMVTFDDVSALHRANQRLENALEALQESRREIEQKNADLQRLANLDYLTGCLNRRAFARDAELAFAAAMSKRGSFATMMIDIDHFKSINDRFGHAVGDRVIKAVAALLMSTARESDFVGRYGGEEFCIALPDTGVTAATTIGHRIREAIETEVTNSVNDIAGLRVTVSVGVCTIDKSHTTLQSMVQAADEALYEAKQSGRNRVRVASMAHAIV